MFVKICGITSEEDALLAVAQGADAVGFIFAPSVRQIAAGLVRDIVRRIPPEVLAVGVFRNEAPKRVVDTCHFAGLRAAQLHGHESQDDCRWVRERVGLVIKGFPAGSPELERFDGYGADIALVDSPTPGSGHVFDWSLAEGAPANRRLLLAGGLTPTNVAEAIARVRPWGVDVASGVERAPGVKDPIRVGRFIANAKDAAPTDYAGADFAPFDWQQS
jgi:phosphoribosylanthranilate isomerase